jgi:hypothetical protein
MWISSDLQTWWLCLPEDHWRTIAAHGKPSAGTTEREGAGRVADLIRRYPLVSYFVIAYAGTWLVWAVFVLSRDGSGLLPSTVR